MCLQLGVVQPLLTGFTIADVGESAIEADSVDGPARLNEEIDRIVVRDAFEELNREQFGQD